MALRHGVVLQEHQPAAVEYMMHHHYAVLADEQGLGKTLESIAVGEACGADKILVVCPRSLKFEWMEEYQKFTDRTVKVGFANAEVNIITYGQLHKAAGLFATADVVIVEEAHYIKNMSAQRTATLHKLIEKHRPPRVMLLTGTPVSEGVVDYYSYFRLCDHNPARTSGRRISEKFPTVDHFARHFTKVRTFQVPVRMRNGREFKKEVTKYEGVRNETELTVYRSGKYFRREAKEVLNLPPVLPDKMIPVSYKDDPRLDRAFQEYIRSREINSTVKEEAAAAKAPFTAEYVSDLIDSGVGPIAVFTDHPRVVRIIRAKMNKRYRVAVIDGAVDPQERSRIVRHQFQEGQLDALICTIPAACEGYTMTISKNMVINDVSWSPRRNSQMRKRIDRIGQKSRCTYHYIIGSKIDRKITVALRKKEKVVKAIT